MPGIMNSMNDSHESYKPFGSFNTLRIDQYSIPKINRSAVMFKSPHKYLAKNVIIMICRLFV